jgi:hypothetical protein
MFFFERLLGESSRPIAENGVAPWNVLEQY